MNDTVLQKQYFKKLIQTWDAEVVFAQDGS